MRLDSDGALAGRVAFVSGAGQGVGRGIALTLAGRGASVVLAGRTARKLDAVALEVRARGVEALTVVCDVGDRAQVDAAIAATVERFRRLDVVVNNAQSTAQGPIMDITEEDLELNWRTGALATLYVMQAAFPHLREKGGSVVNLGSTTAIEGAPGFGAYAMAKEAIRGLSRIAAREWGPFDIRVNVVVPTALTPAAEDYARANPERFADTMAAIPLRRMGDPEQDIGRAVAALVSDDFAYLTGATLMLNGGRVLLG